MPTGNVESFYLAGCLHVNVHLGEGARSPKPKKATIASIFKNILVVQALFCQHCRFFDLLKAK